MSYQYSVNERRRRQQNRGTSPSFNQIRGGHGYQQQHHSFGYWVPLALTVGAAAVGIAAWIWSERRDGDEDEGHGHGHGRQRPSAGEFAGMSGGLTQAGGPIGAEKAGARPEDYPSQPSGLQEQQQQQQQQHQQNYPPGPGPEGAGGPAGAYGSVGVPIQGGFRDVNDHHGEEYQYHDDHSFVSRVSNAFGVGRSASPAQKTLDWAGKKVLGGVAAAGAMAGAAMKSMGMSGEDDAERWSEEADNRHADAGLDADHREPGSYPAYADEPTPGIKRRGTADEFYSGAVGIPRVASVKTRNRTTVAVVVSALGSDQAFEADELGSHASILSHLPKHINPDTTRVLVLIYAPGLKIHPLQAATASSSSSAANLKASSQSMTSSYSNISQRDAETPGEYPEDDEHEKGLADVAPNPIDESSPLFKTLYNEAEAVVEAESAVLPYTTKNGHKHILKSLGPEIVYIQESLCGDEGEVVAELSGWVRQIVVVIGDEGGTGGLVDTDDEDSREKLSTKWWTKEERTGLGKRVAVVDGAKIGDDWERRLNDKSE